MGNLALDQWMWTHAPSKRWKPGNWIARVEEAKLRSKRRKKQRRAELFRQKKKLARQRLSLVLTLRPEWPRC
jgi:predicted Rossmann fold nucleotide-binding protein DprA/Smf involved in DNA uptake